MTDPRRHLVAVNRFYWPDHSATGQLLTDVCERAAADGFRVTVIASRMGYDASDRGLPAREMRNGVAIRRVATTRLGRDRLWRRSIDYLSFYLTASLALLAVTRRGNVILVKTDPPLISIPAALVARLRGARLVNWMQDVFPEVAGALGLRWAAGLPGGVLRRARNRSLKGAAANIAICDSMAEKLAAEGIPRERIRVIPNWPHRALRPVPREENRLRAEWGLSDRFVIGYSGNLGRAHAASHVADLIRQTAGIAHLTWLFVGGGSGHAVVRAAAEAAGADVRFQPYQPRNMLSESLSAADLHLVTLDPACEGLIMPSKLVGVMAAGCGILALCDPEGEVAREVQAAGIGRVLDPAVPAAWQGAVMDVTRFGYADRLGARSRRHYENAFTNPFPLDNWIEVLRDLAPRKEPVGPAMQVALSLETAAIGQAVLEGQPVLETAPR